MKQLHIVKSIALNSGGIGVASLRYAESLASAGVDVRLLALEKSNSELSILSPSQNFQVLSVDNNGIYYLFKRLSGCINEGNFDVVHIHGTWTVFLAIASFLAARRKIKIVISPHGCLDSWALEHKKWKKKAAFFCYQRRALNSASIFFATSRQEFESIRMLGIDAPIAVIPLGVDIPLRVNSYLGSRSFLFLSRIHPVKGLLNLVRAWAKVRRPGWRITIAGPDEGGHLAEIRAEIFSLGIGDDFDFPGMLIGSLKEKAYSTASVFILPSYSENFGMVVAEALAHNLPVITTTGTPWEILTNIKGGWWVSPTVDAVARAMQMAMDLDPKDLWLMGSRGRSLVAEKYSWKSTAESACEAYQWLLGRLPHHPIFIEEAINKIKAKK